MKKRTIGLLLAMCMSLGIGMTAWAADTKIEKVEIEFSWDQAPEPGQEPGSISAKALNSQFKVSDVYFKDDVDTWKLGDKPEATAVLVAASGYRFAYNSRSHFTISGCDAKFKKARYYDDYSTMDLTVTFPQIVGRLDPVENLYWKDQEAEWDDMGGVRNYEVKLYRDDRLVTTVTTSKNFYDFTGYFTKEGEYSFKVRGVAKYNGRPGDWSDWSDTYVITKQQAEAVSGGSWVQDSKGWWYSFGTGGYPSQGWYKVSGVWYYFNRDGYILTGWQKIDNDWYYLGSSGALKTGWQSINGSWYCLAGNGEMLTGWQQVNGRWYYMNSGGVMLTGWQQISGHWYFLDSSGAMLTGWQQIGGHWYYLDGSGMMLTGWQQINGRRYYLNSSGVMLTGWQNINGSWYYLDGSGALLTNTRTPDGYYVDGSGVYRS